MNKYLLTFIVFVFTFYNSVAQLPSYVSRIGLIGWWGFNGSPIENFFNDESENKNHGTPFGATFTTDRYGVSQHACILNGLNDYVMTSGSASVSELNSNNQLTVSLWMQLPQQFNQSTLYLVGNGTYNQNGFFVLIDQNDGAYGKNNYVISFGVGSKASATYITNQNEVSKWTNIIGTYQNGIISLYINGVLKGSNVVSTSVNSPHTKFVFADWDNPTTPNVKVRKIDDIGVWNRAFSYQEVIDLFNSRSPCVKGLEIAPKLSVLETGKKAVFYADPAIFPSNFQWQTDFGQGFINLKDIADYSGTNTKYLIISSVTVKNHNQPIRLITTTNNCIDTSNISFIKIIDTCFTIRTDTVKIIVNDTVKIAVSDTLIIKTKATGIQEDKFYSFLIYPNPTNSYVTIDCGDQAEVSSYSFTITNSLGQERVSSKFTTRFQQIDISKIGGAGLYIISIRDGNNTVIETRKLLIQ